MAQAKVVGSERAKQVAAILIDEGIDFSLSKDRPVTYIFEVDNRMSGELREAIDKAYRQPIE